MNNTLALNIKKRILHLVFIGLLIIPFDNLSAQSQVDSIAARTYQVDQFIVGSTFAGAIASGQLSTNIPNTAGFTVSALTKISKSQSIYLGFSSGFYTYEDYNIFYFLTDNDGFLYEVEEITKSKLFNLHGVIRLQPFIDFFIHPYVEGYFGGKHFYTRTEVAEIGQSGANVTGDGRGGDWAVSVGGGVGFNIPIHQEIDFGVELDVKCLFTKGNAANYTVLLEDLDSTNIIDTFDAFETQNSSTDLFMPQIGLIVYFGG